MNLIYYKKIDEYMNILSEFLNAKMFIEKECFKLTKDNRTVNIYLSEENYKFSLESILFAEKGDDGKKYITFDLLDRIFMDDSVLNKKIFECWLFNEPYENYETTLKSLNTEENSYIKKNDLEIQEKNITYKAYSKLDVTNINDVITNSFGKEFVYNTKNKFFHSKDDSIICISLISKNYEKTSYNYWYSYHTYQKTIFEKCNHSFLLLSFNDSKEVLAIPSDFINKQLYRLNSTGYDEKKYWHLHIKKKSNRYELRIPKVELIDITEFLVVKVENQESSDDDLVINIKSMKNIVKNR